MSKLSFRLQIWDLSVLQAVVQLFSEPVYEVCEVCGVCGEVQVDRRQRFHCGGEQFEKKRIAC